MLPRYRGLGFGGGGEAWRSPTWTSMIMASNGDVIVNDPAAAGDSAVSIVYPRGRLESIWQQHGGVAYVTYPPG
jgi:hypothetical protein